ncbi:hypothetical protein [Marinilabilia rubra]|uniref:Uncharacterized protein n=1 Tax=Marinilabilia rubra TaxID=2162893 RepID=A0A2U2BBX6_9BACT|nr:hypothetical protein [Marinilabilia rubra]PWE00575.1 hypothetical protein DDZ16_02965 [Marinilabilia rubra]
MTEEAIKFRDIDKIKFIVKDATGLDIMYAYDDLIFPEHGAFIIRFNDDDDKSVFCHFHKDCTEPEEKQILTSLGKTGQLNDLRIIKGTEFEMRQKDKEQFEIKFR